MRLNGVSVAVAVCSGLVAGYSRKLWCQEMSSDSSFVIMSTVRCFRHRHSAIDAPMPDSAAYLRSIGCRWRLSGAVAFLESGGDFAFSIPFCSSSLNRAAHAAADGALNNSTDEMTGNEVAL